MFTYCQNTNIDHGNFQIQAQSPTPPHPQHTNEQKQSRNSHEPSLSFQNIAAIMLNHALDPFKKIVVSGDCSNPSTNTDHQKGS